MPDSRRASSLDAQRTRAGDIGETLSHAGVQLVSGHLTGVDDEGRLLFRPEGSTEAPVPVAIGIESSDGALLKAARQNRRALVALTGDRTPRRILVGLVRERVSTRAITARPGTLEVGMDGETLKLTAEHDIELRCGEASIKLRRDGKVEINGTNVLSASRGPNRIKGATIALN